MRFGVSYGNHGNGIHVEDILIYVRNALRAAGEEAYLLPTLLSDSVNIVLECFTQEQVQQIRELRRLTEARFIILVTEYTDGETFNSFIKSGVGHYADRDMWKARFNNFLEAAAEADAIWSLSDFGVSLYQPLFRDKPVLKLPIGFDPFYPEPHHSAPEHRDVDLLFTGNETPHRKAILEELSEKYYVLTTPVTTPNTSRVDMIRRSKVGLHINLSSGQYESSFMRQHCLLMNAAPVVSERATLAGPLDDFITQFDGHNFVRGVDDYLKSGEWKWRGIDAYQRYRENRPIAQEVRRVLADSFDSVVNAVRWRR